jgi:2-polyprenyl-6-methoxyphenol hydroxylase-like FAD-dependent oxidoreductase
MFEVAVIGYGPTGMLAALLLGRAGHRVAVIERYRTLYNLPRVGIVHDDILRMFQEIGIGPRIAPATHFLTRYEMAHDDQILLSNDIEPYASHGWPEFTSIYQPAFEAELDIEVKKLSSVEVHQGWRVTGIAQHDNGVSIIAEGEEGRRHEIEARYVIAADGGNSFVRSALGIELEDLGFDQDWLVIDAKQKRGILDRPPLRQFCNPQQPGMTMQMGPDHRRWSFMIFPGESQAEAMKPENVWNRLARPEGGTSDDYDLVRVASYKFQSRVAKTWRVGPIFLAGDAVHMMPPFLAQGLCSGFRDAHNLAWKLDHVLRGVAGEALLDAYVAEREPNARATTIESMKVGLNVNERDPEKVKARDAQLLALQEAKARGEAPKQLIAFRVPGFTQGFVATNAPGAGDVFPQGRVRKGDEEGLFDDIAGRGFMLVYRGASPLDALSGDMLDFFFSLGGHVVEIAAPAGACAQAVADLDGRYTGLMDALGCDVLLKRPDYYLFGACRTAADLDGLMQDMRRQLVA